MSFKPVTKTDHSFSEIVRKNRKNRIDKSMFSSQKMAELLNLTRSAYSRKETCLSRWSLGEAIEVCQILGIESINVEKLGLNK